MQSVAVIIQAVSRKITSLDSFITAVHKVDSSNISEMTTTTPKLVRDYKNLQPTFDLNVESGIDH